MTTNIFKNIKVDNAEFQFFLTTNALLTYIWSIYSNSAVHPYYLQLIVANKAV